MSTSETPSKATLEYAQTMATAEPGSVAIAATAVSETVAGNTEPTPSMLPNAPSKTAVARSVVLPRKAKDPAGEAKVEWSVDEHPRFETIKTIGEGGMGEVALVFDQDIKRRVAVKRLRDENRTPAALLRFAEEVRVVGELEHPGIVPVHDVGIDERGQHYAVMKFLEGETIETIIEKLKAGSPEHVRRFTMEYRARLFLKVLEAIRFAHSHGIIHRDLKPANIMVGPFGEVTILDWGIAKRIRVKENTEDARKITLREDSKTPEKQDAKLVETQVGARVGTPLYMSPEQAAGKNEELDERSDIFSLCVVFYELLALEHPLASKQTVQEVLLALQETEWDHLRLRIPALSKGVPCELLRVLQEGFYRDPGKRYQSVVEMEQRLQQVLDGLVPPVCYITKSKRGAHEFMHWIDRHPYVFGVVYYLTIPFLVTCVALLLWRVFKN